MLSALRSGAGVPRLPKSGDVEVAVWAVGGIVVGDAFLVQYHREDVAPDGDEVGRIRGVWVWFGEVHR